LLRKPPKTARPKKAGPLQPFLEKKVLGIVVKKDGKYYPPVLLETPDNK
jgi:hypothetical protein